MAIRYSVFGATVVCTNRLDALENFKQIVTINRGCRIAAINLEQRESFNNHVAGRRGADLLFKL